MDPNTYRRIGYDELVTYAISNIAEGSEEITFERIVAECYQLFPERFALRGYPHWPDSAVVNKSWLRCRTDKNYIVGSVREGFRLTAQGMDVAQRVKAQLEGRRPMPGRAKPIMTEARTRQGRLVRSLEGSSIVNRYKTTGTIEHMTDYDFCDVLMCTIETGPQVLRASLRQFQDAARSYGRTDLVQFLEMCEHGFAHLLASAEANHYEGGMTRRKRARREENDQ